MIKRSFLSKAVQLSQFQDVNLTLISKDKIIGDIYVDSAMDIIPIAIKDGYVISFSVGSKRNRLNFECFMDLPF